MPIIFTILGASLADFAEGAILAASVYLVSREGRSHLTNEA